MRARHIDTFGTPRPLSSDLTLALVSVLLIFVAKPLVAQTFGGAETTTMGSSTTSSSATTTTTSGGDSSATPSLPTSTTGGSNSTMQSGSTSGFASPLQGGYVNPIHNPNANDRGPKTGASQSQRSANANQNNQSTGLQVQPLPECRVDDTACIEQRNNQNKNTNSLNSQTAPAFIR